MGLSPFILARIMERRKVVYRTLNAARSSSLASSRPNFPYVFCFAWISSAQ